MAATAHPPVQLTAMIQPQGILLALSEPDLLIHQVSKNCFEHLSIPAETLPGQPLKGLLDRESYQILEANLASAANLNDFNLTGFQTLYHCQLSLTTPQGLKPFDAILHRTNGPLILELEPLTSENFAPRWSLTNQIRTTINHLQTVTDLTSFLEQSAIAIRELMGCDRVHVYQFDHQGAGAVIAEAKRIDLPSYLGLHFPATDIPASVRELYRQGMLRFVADVSVSPVELFPPLNPLTGAPLDLSLAVLRGVDPCCATYHQNMGVAAFLVIPLIKQGQLWGLLSCHHSQPLFVPYALRTACDVIGQFVAAELANQINQEELTAIARLRALHADFLTAIAEAEDFRTALIHPQPRLLNLVNAGGAAVCLDGEITLVGQTPNRQQVEDLLTWIAPQIQESLFASDALAKIYPAALDFRAVGSGLLVLKISQVRRYYILWFRPEVEQTVNWAGNPQDSFTIDAEGGVSLCPRASFALWQETVQLTALPWQAAERDSALELRNAIVGIVLHKADELAQINCELEQRNRELDSFAFAASHDLQEPLRGIHNFSTLLLKGSGQNLDDAGRSRLQTVIRLTQRMETLIESLLKFSRLGQTELQWQTLDLNDLVAEAIEVVRSSRFEAQPEVYIPRALPAVRCDPVLLTEVLTNLFSNACKYTDQPPPWIEVGYLDGIEDLTLYVRDRGIGIRPRHFDTIFRLFKRLHEQDRYGGGTGVGLAISRRIIERHGGRIWVESTYGSGSTFYLTLPSPASTSG